MKSSTSARLQGRSEPQLPELGVGVTYSTAIEPLIQRHSGLIQVLEVEPQTTWLETDVRSRRYRVPKGVLDHINQLPGRRLVHSVGAPLGGTLAPESQQLDLLRAAVRALDSPWVSEHLNFNATHEFRTGFLLPPRQTAQGVETAISSIRAFKDRISVPLAVETGVSYLRTRADEMPDGTFVAAVVEGADCGLLLDLHNIFANALNGRQSIDDFVQQIPLQRVWEVHLAGGFESGGFWLDAHSGAIPDSLFDLSKSLVSALPNLKAIIFEIFPSFVPVAGFDTILAQLERLHLLWELRGRSALPRSGSKRLKFEPRDNVPSPAAWERALGALVIGKRPNDNLATELAGDPGVGLVAGLLAEFRAGMIVGVLRLTSRHLMRTLGPDVFRSILEDFWSKTTPQQFALTEARLFADYLAALDLQVPQLSKILEFERVVLATLADEQPRVITFDFDPLPLFRALSQGQSLDQPLQEGRFEIEVTPDLISDVALGHEDSWRKLPPH